MLSDFDGCVIVVSHDRQFVNNLVDHIFVFDGGGQVNDWSGDYTALRQFLKTMEEEREAAKALTGNPDVNPLELTDEDDSGAAEKQPAPSIHLNDIFGVCPGVCGYPVRTPTARV